jgi:glucose/arabinose dehydrogenase
MRREDIYAITFLLLLLFFWGGFFFWKNLRGSAPALKPPTENIADLLPVTMRKTSNGAPAPATDPPPNTIGVPLDLPSGFSVSVFAKNLPDARVMIFDKQGNMLVSRPSGGAVTKLEVQNGVVSSQSDLVAGLNHPHGLALDPDTGTSLFIGEEDQISKISLDNPDGKEKISDLPSGGEHTTRTLLFGPDGRLYVSVGSSCNVCVENDPRRAAISSLNKDGSDFRTYALGLRNAVFMAVNPRTKEIWATDMGRDFLGDDLPPDTIDIIKQGKNYGWPYCYGKQVHDSNFDPSGSKISFCMTTEPSLIDIPAHSAPLGLNFLSGSQFPSEYQNDLLAAYHGSWNRSVPTGYKIVRFKFDAGGNYLGSEDFITGWLTGSRSSLGRPVGIVTGPDGKIYISDDKAGVIYQVSYQ